jgi:hypothetical protein
VSFVAFVLNAGKPKQKLYVIDQNESGHAGESRTSRGASTTTNLFDLSNRTQQGNMMGRANFINILLVLISIVLATAVPAWAQGAMTSAGQSATDNAMGGPGNPEDMYLTINVDGKVGKSANFAVVNMATNNKDGNVALIMPGAPLTGTYNISNDMGYVSTLNYMPATMTVNTANNLSIPVAGTAAVLGLHDMNVLAQGKGYKMFEFGQVSFFTPNGTAMASRPDRPIRVTYDEDRKMVVIDAYPSFTRLLAGVLKTGDAFPAEAPAVPMESLTTAKSAALGARVGYEKPAYGSPPR